MHPPGSEEFESTAVGWLLDVVPPDYRLHGVLRRYPVALATMARYHSKACVEGARQGYRTARTELAGALPPESELCFDHCAPQNVAGAPSTALWFPTTKPP